MNSAYKAIERSGLGNSEHSCVLLLPKYIQKVKRSKPVTQTSLSWTDSAVEALQDCFEQTDWTTFLDQSTNLQEYSEIVCDYIKFCENVCLPRKTITLYANNNAWFNKQVRRKLHEKDEAYRNQKMCPDLYKSAKTELRKYIQDSKRRHRDKIRDSFNTRDSKKLCNSENKDPDTHSIICGDFNQANLKTVLPNFYQHVTCPTRGINTLDHCYSKMNSAYKAIERSGLGNSDHSCVLLLPKYIQKVKRSKPVTQTILSWTDSAVEALQDCFEQTDWTTFLDQSTNLHEYSEIVCDYIKFCENVCLPRKTITLCANNNAWFNKQVRRKLHEKDEADRNRKMCPDLYKSAKTELRKCINDYKRRHRDKIRDSFNTRDSKKLWSNLNLITQYKSAKQEGQCDDTTLPDRLNYFYARFDRDNTTTPAPLSCDEGPPFVITEHDVRCSLSANYGTRRQGPTISSHASSGTVDLN
ncbi:reo_6 protein [Plakobranchus ocellatus]|uniref:Reo_6 protein n=1 Tax=Plakobranchus ocellatus TaxID=259542 RepID=A0AAV3YQY9_9GAST|nr:reo_6 protein [Plakobranchus ocellatus]